jgi:hypothetical protein
MYEARAERAAPEEAGPRARPADVPALDEAAAGRV